MNRDAIDDVSIQSDVSTDIESNTGASDLYATENCALLLQDNEKSNDIILRRIAHYYTDDGSRFQRKFQNNDYNGNNNDNYNDDNDDDGNNQQSTKSTRYIRFDTSLRQSNKKSVKRFLFLFGFASMLIILSQLYLVFYYDDRSVQGWEKNRTRRTPVYILPNNKTTILEPNTLCKTDTPILLLIVVFSAPQNFQHRQIIRETWANTSEFNYSKFSTLHAHMKGTYLPINYNNWKNITIRNDNNDERDNSNYSMKPLQNFIEDEDIEDVSSHANFHIQVVFLVGKTENNETQDKVTSESQVYDDLIQENFMDSYNNLTLKSVMMLKWVVKNCGRKVHFIMKCDDDTFVNVPNLIHFLLGGTIPVYLATLHHYNQRTVRTRLPINRLKYHKDILVGSLFCHVKPISNYRSKWFTPRYMYNRQQYPNYLSGSGYVFTIDTAKKLYNASMEMPLLYLEDVYTTGICAEKAAIKPSNHHLFSYLSHKDLCEIRGIITMHEIKSKEMKRAYSSVLNTNVTCPPPRLYAKIRPFKMSKNCN